jgi:general stress protein YciG
MNTQNLERTTTESNEPPQDKNGREAAEAVPFAEADTAPRLHRPRGFAAIDPARVSEIARLGGKAAHRAGTAHQFTSEEARAAGRKGGLASRDRRRSAALHESEKGERKDRG